MPELPEVETARRLLERHLLGRCIVRAATVRDTIVYDGVSARRFASAVRGRRVEAVQRRGKYMYLDLDRPPYPVFHFGMTGRFFAYRHLGDRPRFWKVELLTDRGVRLAMTNARRLGRIRLQRDPLHELPLKRLGFDPLLDLPTVAVLGDLLAKRKGPIKALLLDQHFAAGVGNWIADEVLYQGRIAPQRRACDLTAEEVKRLRSKLGAIVRKAVAVEADKRRFPKTWLFHHRWGRNADAVTARGERIVHATIGGRTTAWVPSVQR